jgi:hypothetical protein
MTKKELYAHPGWESCTFEGAEMSTLLLGLQTTFREKLEWLEEAETLALRLQGKPDAPPASQPPALNDASIKSGRLKFGIRGQKSEAGKLKCENSKPKTESGNWENRKRKTKVENRNEKV